MLPLSSPSVFSWSAFALLGQLSRLSTMPSLSLSFVGGAADAELPNSWIVATIVAIARKARNARCLPRVSAFAFRCITGASLV
jgi:hypothetical protein